MAIRNRSKKLREGIVFHSGEGGQYYTDSFLALTKNYKFKNSMCEYAWENGKAERINGVIKKLRETSGHKICRRINESS